MRGGKKNRFDPKISTDKKKTKNIDLSKVTLCYAKINVLS